MNRHHRKDKVNTDRLIGFFAGFLTGSLVGAGIMLLLAPRTGKRTRSQIQQQGAKLRHQVATGVEDMATEVGDKAQGLADDVKQGAGKLQKGAQDMIQ
jgi:gas vesicle protein